MLPFPLIVAPFKTWFPLGWSTLYHLKVDFWRYDTNILRICVHCLIVQLNWKLHFTVSNKGAQEIWRGYKFWTCDLWPIPLALKQETFTMLVVSLRSGPPFCYTRSGSKLFERLSEDDTSRLIPTIRYGVSCSFTILSYRARGAIRHIISSRLIIVGTRRTWLRIRITKDTIVACRLKIRN